MTPMQAVSTLLSAFRQEVNPETVALYAKRFADMPPALVAATVDHILDNSKFFPSISEIRVSAVRVAGLLPKATPAQAIAVIRKADVSRPVYRRDGSYVYTEREWSWPDDVDPLTLDAIRDVLAEVGEPVNAEGAAHFGWEMGFQKTYEAKVEEITKAAVVDLSHALPAHERKALPA